MDIAMQTGWPLSFIARLPERELGLWDRYARFKGLPMRRLELGLARNTMWIAQSMGGAKDVTLKDFLFDPHDEAPDDSGLTSDEWQELKDDIGFDR